MPNIIEGTKGTSDKDADEDEDGGAPTKAQREKEGRKGRGTKK